MQVKDLLSRLQQRFGDILLDARLVTNEVTVEIAPQDVLDTFTALRDEFEFSFDQLIDVCGVDYARYGFDEWQTSSATGTGFSRGFNARTHGRGHGNLLQVYAFGRCRFGLDQVGDQTFDVFFQRSHFKFHSTN